jgi:hypothetical protein
LSQAPLHGGDARGERGGEGDSMQKALIIQSNGAGKEDLEACLRQGWKVVNITFNSGPSYNDFLIILEYGK